MATDHLIVNKLSTKDLIRIFSRINIDPAIHYQGSPCWIWIGRKDKYGYVKIDWKCKTTTLHRVLFAFCVGPLPNGRSIEIPMLDHLCRRPACCNPIHLDLVSARTNTLRGDGPAARNARKTHCIHGHEFNATNTGIDPNGRRYCKQCKCIAARKYVNAHRERHQARCKQWRENLSLEARERRLQNMREYYYRQQSKKAGSEDV